MKRKVVGVVILSLVCLSSLSGCGKKVNTVEDLVKEYTKEDRSNYHTSGDLDLSIGADMEGMSISIPIGVSIDMDVLDKSAHGTLGMNMSMFGASVDTDVEVYIDGSKDTVKVYQKQDDEWTVTDNSVSIDSLMGVDDTLFSGADLEKGEDTYIVTQSLSALLDNDTIKELFEENESSLGTGGMSYDDVISLFEDAEIKYTFDNETYDLLKVSMEESEGSCTFDSYGEESTMTMSLGFDFENSRFGEITKDDVSVPEDVVSSAKEADELEDIDDSFLYDEESSMYSDFDTTDIELY